MPSADDQIDQTDETAIAPSIGTSEERTVVAAVATAPTDERTVVAPEAPAPLDQRTAVATAAPPPQQLGPHDDTLAPGSIFHGDFKISDSIAKKGGMGEVYRATNTINNTIVAIKMIRADLSQDPDLVAKFIQEDEALRQLNNPAVVRYYGVRRDPVSGRYYIQMEYVDGPTLGEYVRERGAVPAPEARALCRHLALGLEDAHRSGIVHRDLSPDNVLLGNSELKNAKIIDFGIAKVASTGDFTTFRTSFVGKYRYASPEHFSASAPIDQRSDIYSLGLVIAAAAAGKPLEMGRDELSGATARLTVPDLSVVPVALRPMLTRMLDPDATRRPTAAELVVQLADRKERTEGSNGGQVLLWLGLVAAVMAGGAGGAYYLKQHPEILASISGKSSDSKGGPTVFGPGTGSSTGQGSTASDSSTGNRTAGNTGPGTGTTSGTGITGTSQTIFQPTGPGTTGTPTTGPLTQTARVPTGPDQIEALHRAVNAIPGACATMWSEVVNGRVQVAGLLRSEAEVDGVKATVDRLNYTVDNEAVASPLACETLQLLAQLGKVNAIAGGNRPVVSTTHAVVRVGESAEVVATGFLINKHFLYTIKIDGTTGTAVVEHETISGNINKPFSSKGSAPGWDMVLVLATPNELPALSALNQTTLDQLNIALQTEKAKLSNHGDVQTGYQFVRRIS
jgi:serine/threonine protein kinase